MSRSKSSHRWLQEHFKDPYVKRAQQQGYRSRAAYKLLELQQRDKLIKPGMTVVDLGASPGGWTQVVGQLVGEKGRIIALDILPMTPIAGVLFIQGDFREPEINNQLLHEIGSDGVDLVISDMSPNISGVGSVDQPRMIYLAELTLEMAKQVLKPGGTLLLKIFQGTGFDAFLQELRRHFKPVLIRKPDASRSRSAEVYLLAKNYMVQS